MTGTGVSPMRAIVIASCLLLVAFGSTAPLLAQRPAEPQNLGAFAQRIGLRDVDGFVDTVQSLRRTPPAVALCDERRGASTRLARRRPVRGMAGPGHRGRHNAEFRRETAGYAGPGFLRGRS